MVLDNKMGITDSLELARVEEEISKKKALRLFESGMLDTFEAGTFESLSKIHQYLFDEVYDFAGKVRNVNITKGNFRFASVLYLEDALKNIEKMPQSTFDEIVKKYIEMNVAHPFREGNGRSARIWLDAMLKKELLKVIDWSRVEKSDYLHAMERSPVKDVEISILLREALTDKINDRDVYMKGIDASYLYEGYNIFRTEDLAKSRQCNNPKSAGSCGETRK
ncbi:MAG: cell filamentation protein Fic [Bacteroidia bacterium]|nr:cell filamentation protein Fic [Bacteroidia bacterium]